MWSIDSFIRSMEDEFYLDHRFDKGDSVEFLIFVHSEDSDQRVLTFRVCYETGMITFMWSTPTVSEAIRRVEVIL